VFGWFWFVHTRFPWSETTQSQPLFLTQQAIPMGWL